MVEKWSEKWLSQRREQDPSRPEDPPYRRPDLAKNLGRLAVWGPSRDDSATDTTPAEQHREDRLRRLGREALRERDR
jgi:hypothetical protein